MFVMFLSEPFKPISIVPPSRSRWPRSPIGQIKTLGPGLTQRLFLGQAGRSHGHAETACGEAVFMI